MLEKAIEIESDADTYNSLGLMHYYLGNQDKALESLKAEKRCAALCVLAPQRLLPDTGKLWPVCQCQNDAFAGAADTLLVLEEEKNLITLNATGKDIESQKYEVEFDKTDFSWSIKENNPFPFLTPEQRDIIELLKK